MFRNKILILDLPDKGEHDLRSANRKGRNDHISAAPHGVTDDFCKLQSMVSLNLFMQPCAIGGFHHDIIGFLRKYRIPEKRLILIPDIPGKYNLAFLAPLSQPQSREDAPHP